MAAADADEKNGRVKTAEFYQMQIKMRDDMNKSFVDITKDMNDGFADVTKEIASVKNTTTAMVSQLETACKQAEKNHDDITSIKRQSNRLDAGVLVISGIWSTIIALASGQK